MTTTPRPNAIEAAKQGNPKAIAILLNQALKSHGHTAKVIRNEAALRILVEGSNVPDQATIGSLIETGLRNLNLAEITPQVQLYGQQSGQSLPAWDQSINLGADDGGANIFSFDTVTVEIPKPLAPKVAPPQNPTAQNPTAKAATIRSMPTAEMPKNYMVPAIFVLLLTVFPLSIVPLVYATQVAGKYDRGDYEGAETSSSRAKLWCMINAGVAAPLYLLVGGLMIFGVHAFSGAVARAGQEREVADRLNTIMRAEQAYYFENERFAPNLSDLGVLPRSPKAAGGDPKLKEAYTYQITVLDAKSMQVTAIPKRANFHSFTTGVFFQGAGESATLVGTTCRSEKPSMMAVKVPLLKGTTPTCAPGSKPPENRRSTANEDAAAGEVESPTSPAPSDELGG
jgi:type II secretory pathway pseudopilin PulG